MSDIFPPEIHNPNNYRDTIQHHFQKNHSKSKIIYILVILTIIISIASLPFIKINLSIQNRGIVRSSEESNQIQIPVNSELKDVFIYENKSVQKGDTLLKLKTDKIDKQISALNTKLQQNYLFIKDLKYLIDKNYNALKTDLYKQSYKQYASRLHELETHLEQFQKEHEIAKELFNSDIIPKLEYLKTKNKYDVANTQLNFTKEEFINNYQLKLNNLKLENIDLISNISQLNKDKQLYTILAPITGSITQFSGYQKGSFVIAGQTIATISPNNNLIIECYVSPTDIGHLTKGQETRFQFDAFNYNQWGMGHGEILEIFDDIINHDKQAVFKVRCSLQEQHLQLKNGVKGKLKKGMTLTARFFLVKRSLWQLLYDKTDQWLNPKLIESI